MASRDPRSELPPSPCSGALSASPSFPSSGLGLSSPSRHRPGSYFLSIFPADRVLGWVPLEAPSQQSLLWLPSVGSLPLIPEGQLALQGQRTREVGSSVPSGQTQPSASAAGKPSSL